MPEDGGFRSAALRTRPSTSGSAALSLSLLHDLLRQDRARGQASLDPQDIVASGQNGSLEERARGVPGRTPMALPQLHLGSRRGQSRDPSYIILMTLLDTVPLNVNL
jgi:hypothetical protein